MKLWLTALDRKFGVNPMVSRMFNIPDFDGRFADPADVICLSFNTPKELFELNVGDFEIFCQSKAPVVIVDTNETRHPSFLLGTTEMESNDPFFPIHNALKSKRVILYFKREYFAKYQESITQPLDWVLQAMTPHAPDSLSEFEKRPIDVFMSWGYSSESRPRMMGELLKQAGRFCAHFCLCEEDLEIALKEGRQRIFALLHVPHYRRIHFSKIFDWQSKSKLSLSLKGAGQKCFRDSEASYNAVMARQEPSQVIWTYPWIDGNNCIGLPNASDGEIDAPAAVEVLWNYLRINQGRLYPIYLAGIQNCQNYYAENYARRYLLPKIQGVLK